METAVAAVAEVVVVEVEARVWPAVRSERRREVVGDSVHVHVAELAVLEAARRAEQTPELKLVFCEAESELKVTVKV